MKAQRLSGYTAQLFLSFIFISLFVTAPAVCETLDPIPDIIVVKIPVSSVSAPAASHFVDGCSINRISFTEKGAITQNLAPRFLSARDPSLSPDMNKILFAGKRYQSSYYQIYQMNIDGTNIEQLTDAKTHHSSPLQVGSLFYLNDTAPTPQIVFGRQTYDSPPITAFFASNLDGSKPRQITHNLFSDLEADVLPNGRLVFSSNNDIHLLDRPSAQLMAVNIDGTDLMPVSGDQSPNHHLRMASVGFNSRIYFIETNETDEFSGGSISSVSQLRPLHSYEKVTTSEDFIYPCPLPDSSLLASQKSQDGTYRLVKIGKKGGHSVLAAEKGYHLIDAQPIAARNQVRGRSSVVGFRHKNSGVFFCMDIYESDREEIRALEPGSVSEVLITEAKRSSGDADLPLIAVSNAPDSGDPGLLYYHRLIGKAPVEKDGSFHIRVPSETPLAFHLLDKQGKIVASQHSFTWVMHGESRGCIGCHEDRELTPANVFIEAVKKPPVELLPAEKARQPLSLREVK